MLSGERQSVKDESRRLVEREIVEAIEDRQVLGGVATAFLAALVVFVVSSRQDSMDVYRWIGFVLLASLGKLFLSKVRVLFPSLAIRTRKTLLICSALLTGVLWSIPVSFVNFDDQVGLATVILIVSGIISGSVSAYLGDVACMLLISTVPCASIVWSLVEGFNPIPFPAVASVITFYVYIMMLSANTKKNVYELFMSKQKNNALVEQLKEVQLFLVDMAHRDDLTGLPNRRQFVEEFDAACADYARTKSKFAIMFIDMNEFKHINDNYGHEVGDGVLVEMSKAMKSALRESDVVARLGGDEFVALVRNVSSKESMEALVDKLSDSLARKIDVNDCCVDVSASIGGALYPDDADTLERLLSHADSSMYSAKRSSLDY